MSDIDALVFRLNFATNCVLEGNSHQLQADALQIHIDDCKKEIRALRKVIKANAKLDTNHGDGRDEE
jgi:hypothetical protein